MGPAASPQLMPVNIALGEEYATNTPITMAYTTRYLLARTPSAPPEPAGRALSSLSSALSLDLSLPVTHLSKAKRAKQSIANTTSQN